MTAEIAIPIACALGLAVLCLGALINLARTEQPRWCDRCTGAHYPQETCPNSAAGFEPKEAA